MELRERLEAARDEPTVVRVTRAPFDDDGELGYVIVIDSELILLLCISNQIRFDGFAVLRGRPPLSRDPLGSHERRNACRRGSFCARLRCGTRPGFSRPRDEVEVSIATSRTLHSLRRPLESFCAARSNLPTRVTLCSTLVRELSSESSISTRSSTDRFTPRTSVTTHSSLTLAEAS